MAARSARIRAGPRSYRGCRLREGSTARPPSRKEITLRTLGYLWLSVLGAVTYFVVVRK
jgi:hypothetical protein